jgi:hypothetical protein
VRGCKWGTCVGWNKWWYWEAVRVLSRRGWGGSGKWFSVGEGGFELTRRCHVSGGPVPENH